MTPIITQAELEREILRMVKSLQEECLEELRQASEEAARSEVDYKVRYAKCFLAAQGTGPSRSSRATIETEKELFLRLVSDRRVTTAREKLSAYRSSLDALRTILVGVRDQTH